VNEEGVWWRSREREQSGCLFVYRGLKGAEGAKRGLVVGGVYDAWGRKEVLSSESGFQEALLSWLVDW
jgi:hypothetical protein